ncbi:MAG TPA: response regulator [Bacteroidota bacterium]|nr:response regulator [Bacteroidota bacterium]
MQPSNNPPNGSSGKAQIAKHIQAAIIFSRSKQYDESLQQINIALTLDPQNSFARSFRRKIATELELASLKAGGTQEERIEKVSQLLNNADQLIQGKQYNLALLEIEKVLQIDAQNFYASSYTDRIKQLMSQEGEKLPTPQAPPPPQMTADQIIEYEPTTEPHESHLLMYTELLKEFWFEGALNDQQKSELKKVRTMFQISEEEHNQLERLVQIDAYVEALQTALRDGAVNQNEEKVLEIMRQKYSISIQEHLSAEAKILWAKTHATTKGSVLIVEDEESILKPLTLQLKKHGFDVLAAESVEEALDIIDQTPPAVILADLLFPGGMTGLQFYDHIRKIPKLKSVPFLLMSGINDEFVVRAGMRMGVDNFIAKPFKLETLLAIIEGKLKS